VVVGNHQMAVFNDIAPWDEKLLLYPHSIQWTENIPIANKANAERVSLAPNEPLRDECSHFIECIQSRQKPRTDGEEGLIVLRVLNACQASLEHEKKVELNRRVESAKSYFAHESAVVDDKVEIGKDTKIWHFSHILSGSKIGARCNIGQNVVVGPKVTIGNGCKLQNNVTVFKGVTLEDDVFCGPSMVFTNVYNPRAASPRKDQFRTNLVKKRVTLGANCTIVCGVTIGKHAFIGAGAVINKDVPDFALMVGNPGRQIGWMSKYGEQLDLSLSENGKAVCPYTGDHYITENGVCRVEGR